MRLSTRSRYGARLVLDLALNSSGELLRLSDIAARLDVSVKYLEKLVRELQNAGFVVSKRGPTGGHTLTKPLKSITVGEVVRLLEGETALTICAADGCSTDGHTCSNEHKCVMRAVWLEASKAMFAALDNITFQDLVSESKKHQWTMDFSCKS